MRDLGSAFIAARACEGRTTSYGELWDAIEQLMNQDIGKAWRQVPQLLRHIAEDSFEKTGLILTALVVTDEIDEHPSEGFFRLAARLGLLAESEAPAKGEPWLGMTPVQRRFWMEEVAKLFGFYQDEDPASNRA